MDNLFEVDESSTPLTDEEKKGLIPTWITLRSELNEAESKGILNAEKWFFARKHKNILTENFIKMLHRKMFENVWNWAGQFRTTERNIGIAPWEISSKLKNLLDDTKYWIEHQTYPPDEIGARFHHYLVWIHPFPNGNGRHSRLMTDILMENIGQQRFSWGAKSLIEISSLRQQYIQALKTADSGNISLLLDFVRINQNNI